MQQYLYQICGSPTLLYSPELEMFLTAPENDLLSVPKPPRLIPNAQNYIPDKGDAMVVTDIVYPHGQISLMMNGALRSVTREINSSVAALTPIEEEAIKVCSDINDTYDKLSKLFGQLDGLCGRVADEYEKLEKNVKFPSISKLKTLYSDLKKYMMENSRILKEQNSYFHDTVRAMFEFSIRELEGIDRVIYT